MEGDTVSDDAPAGESPPEIREEGIELEKSYLVYFLASTVKPQQTYVGVTNNFRRRLRQHNGEITGGARRTRAYRPWAPFLHISGLTKTQALQLEWAMKHRRKGGAGPAGRVRTLEFLLGVEKWTKTATPTVELSGVQVKCAWTEARYNEVCASFTKSPLRGLDISKSFECETWCE